MICLLLKGRRDFYNLIPVPIFCVVSELAGPQQDVQRAGGGRERDPSAQTQVLLLRPERGLSRPGPAQSALCTGLTLTLTHFFFPLHVCLLFLVKPVGRCWSSKSREQIHSGAVFVPQAKSDMLMELTARPIIRKVLFYLSGSRWHPKRFSPRIIWQGLRVRRHSGPDPVWTSHRA